MTTSTHPRSPEPAERPETAPITPTTPTAPTEATSRIALSLVTEAGDRDVAQLLLEHDGADVLDRVLTGDPQVAAAHRFAAARLAGRPIGTLVEHAIATAAACDARAIVPGDDEWPSGVNDLAAVHDEADRFTGPPLCLWVRGSGSAAALTDRAVAIVGSRTCSDYGRHTAIEFGYDLARAGWTVISGGAFGIDTAAHRGAIAAGGSTIAVLACGIDRAYPAGNAALFDRIADTGLLLSEWPPGSTPQRHRFLIRNRVIAALGRGVVVAEAALRSGARQTARRAWELDRPVLVVPGPITSPTSAGAHQVARGPGGARIVTRAAEIIEDLGRIGDVAPPLPTPERPHDRLTATEARVLDALPGTGTATVEDVGIRAGVAAGQARRALVALAERGFVVTIGNRAALAERRPDTTPRRAHRRDAVD